MINLAHLFLVTYKGLICKMILYKWEELIYRKHEEIFKKADISLEVGFLKFGSQRNYWSLQIRKPFIPGETARKDVLSFQDNSPILTLERLTSHK